ncbi:NADH dehydrogenase [ubiquinone] 1 beta subcomplex subunit 3 [Brachionus plicatilis]|uniref:NADH dehydrogenase [ubiquinone] 1 beta subcomplex subunit 3 n=1 Tax=Brachionus plicatilis TaxID=10195 RepID=A0A3M7QSZ6_BRAPC|nr:NADH dehydrogenase [ubiquinone] 1 beta subcomplex subunit 3 [Brachionus plicatilis]
MGGHDHHHAPRVINSVISYEIPEPGHHVEDFKAPDWRKFQVKNAPELVKVEQKLASLGLKDPWLRNEVWRYDPQFGAIPKRTFMLKNAATGLKLGFALAVGVILLETGYKKVFGKADHHGHGHH